MKPPIDRVERHVMEEVVHPAHVPFESEAEAAKIGRSRHAGPGGRFLGNRHHTGEALVAEFVSLLQEKDCLEVLATAESVRYPLSRLARVVEIKHRRDRI